VRLPRSSDCYSFPSLWKHLLKCCLLLGCTRHRDCSRFPLPHLWFDRSSWLFHTLYLALLYTPLDRLV
jgi:hypothetical protein